jgi:hypothetical protein
MSAYIGVLEECLDIADIVREAIYQQFGGIRSTASLEGE